MEYIEAINILLLFYLAASLTLDSFENVWQYSRITSARSFDAQNAVYFPQIIR